MGVKHKTANPSEIDYRIKKPPEGEDVPLTVASSLDDFIEFHQGEKMLQRTITPATEGQKAVYSCYWYQYEVCNGGHGQFFQNSTGIMWELILAGLKTIQAYRHFDIFNDTLSLFPKGIPSKDRAKRIRQMKKISKEEIDKLDDRFYDLNETEDIEKTLMNYIQSHPHEFFCE